MTTKDPRTIALGSDTWLTDSRVYNLVWLGRWIERAQSVGRALLWAARRGADDADLFEQSLTMVATVRGVTPADGETTLGALLYRDGGASLRGCLAAARYNATHVAPVEVMRRIGEAIRGLDAAGATSTASAQRVAALVGNALSILDDLHECIEQTWFHAAALSEEEVYRRFIQQQQQQ